ncbi:LexA family protein [Enterococcus hermanniensis]|nr:S24 family peptidase [Enterococcus hermanniensis]
MRTNKEIVELVKKYRTEKNMSQTDLAKFLHIDRANIARWESGARDIPFDRLPQIADALNIDYWHLIGAQAPSLEGRIPIKKFGSVKAGPNGLAFQEFLGYEYFDNVSNSEDFFVLTVDGDSMSGDGINNGDEALIRATNEIEFNGQIAVVIINGDEGTLKHVHFNDGVLMLVPSNPSYSPQIFAGSELENVRIAGVLKEIKRKY